LHSPSRDRPELSDLTSVGQPLLEAQVADAADSLAYDTHDIDDGLSAGLIQVADLLDAIHADTGTRLKELRVDGGGSRSEPLMQFQADILGVPVVRPRVTETTALGAAYLAGLGVGFWKSPKSIVSQWKVEKIFEPKMSGGRISELRARWNDALLRAKAWEKPAPRARRKPRTGRS